MIAVQGIEKKSYILHSYLVYCFLLYKKSGTCERLSYVLHFEILCRIIFTMIYKAKSICQ